MGDGALDASLRGAGGGAAFMFCRAEDDCAVRARAAAPPGAVPGCARCRFPGFPVHVPCALLAGPVPVPVPCALLPARCLLPAARARHHGE